MTSTKVLDSVAKGVSTGAQAITGTGAVVRCASGSVDVMFDSVVYASIQARDGRVFTVSAGDEIELVATNDTTTAWLGEL